MSNDSITPENIVEKARKNARAQHQRRANKAANKYNTQKQTRKNRQKHKTTRARNKSVKHSSRGRSRSRSHSRSRSRSRSRSVRRRHSSPEEKKRAASVTPLTNITHEVGYLSHLTDEKYIGPIVTFAAMDKIVTSDMRFQYRNSEETNQHSTEYWENNIPGGLNFDDSANWYNDKLLLNKGDIVWDNNTCIASKNTGCAWLVDEYNNMPALRRFITSDGRRSHRDNGFGDGDIWSEKELGRTKQHFMIHPVSKNIIEIPGPPHGVWFT